MDAFYQRLDLFEKLKRMKILLIDDDDLIRDSLTVFFKGEGIHLTAVETAERGLEEIKKNNYDIIIVDYRLPGMDGVEFFKHIAKTHRNVFKIIITAYKDQRIVSEAGKIGIQGFIEKPFSSRTIEHALLWLVEQH